MSSDSVKPVRRLTLSGQEYLNQLRGEQTGLAAQHAVVGLLLSFVALLFMVPVLAQSVISLGWLLRGRPGDYREFVAAAQRYEFVDGMIGSHLAIASLMVVAWLLVKYLHDQRPAGLLNINGRMRWQLVLRSAAVAIIVLNAGYWLTRIGQPNPLSFERPAAIWLVVIVLFAPLQAAGEEFLFRGYLPKCLAAFGLHPWLATVLGAIVFALLHGVQDLPLFIDRLAFGLLAGAVVMLIGGLEIGIAVHAVNNVFAYGYAALSGGVNQARAMQSSTWTNTLSNLVGYLICFGICWLWARRTERAAHPNGLD